MPALLPFANALPSALQVPSLQPDFSQVQQIAQRANTIFETGLHQVKNAYSSVINSPVTDSRNLQKKEEYIHNFKEGLKKITKENLRMPQNVQQAENLLSPFWQDQVMLTDMSLTAKLQSAYEQYNQAAYSSDDKIRATANPDSLEDLNNTAEQLRNANGDMNVYNKLGSPRYKPRKNISADMHAWRESDKGMANVEYRSPWQHDVRGNIEYYQDGPKKGQPVPLPDGALVKMTNGAESKPAWIHTVAGRMGNEYDSDFELKAKNYLYKVKKQFKESNPNMPEGEINNLIGKSFAEEFAQSTKELQSYYETVSSKYNEQIADLKEAAIKQPNGLTQKQKDSLAYLEGNKKDAAEKITQLGVQYNERTNSDAISKLTDGSIINALAGTYKNQKIFEYADEFSNQVKSEIVTNEPFFKMLEYKKDLRGQDITQAGNILTAKGVHEGHMVSAMDAAQNNPALWATYQSMGLIPKELNVPTAGSVGVSGGLPPGISYAGRGTDNVNKVPGVKLAEYSRENSVSKIAENAYGDASPSNPTGGLSYKLFLGKIPTDQLNVLSKYQYKFQRGTGIRDENDQISFETPREKQLYREAVKAMYKEVGIPLKDGDIPTPDDITNTMVNITNQKIKELLTNNVKPEEISQYINTLTNLKSEYDRVKADDLIQEKAVTEVAKNNRGMFRHSLVRTPDGRERLIKGDDLPITTGLKGKGSDGKEYTFSPSDLKRMYLDGGVDADLGQVFTELKERPITVPVIKVNGVEITPTPGTNNSYEKLFHNLTAIKNRYGSSKDIGRERSTLNAQTYAHKEFYEEQSGATPSVFPIDIIGKTDYGKGKVYEHSNNTGYFQEAIMPSNNLDITDEKGNSVKDDPETMALLNQLARDPKVAQYIGKNYGLVKNDNIGVSQIAVPIGKLIGGTPGERIQYKGLEQKTFYFTLSPDARGDYLSQLAQIPIKPRESYHPWLDRNPDISTQRSNAALRTIGVDLDLTYNPDAGTHTIKGTINGKPFYPALINTKELGIEGTMNTWTMFNMRAKDTVLANMQLENTKNGTGK